MEAKQNGFWTGFFIGAAIGAAAGLALAPMPGNEARARIRDAVTGLSDQASRLRMDVRGTVGGITARSRQYLEGLRNLVAQSIQAGREAAREKRAELKAEVEAVTEPKQSM